MLAKLTRGNQITIPKKVVELAGLNSENDWLDVRYVNGFIQLVPVTIEDRAPRKASKYSLAAGKNDVMADSKGAYTSEKKGVREYTDEEIGRFLKEDRLDPKTAAKARRLLGRKS